MSKKYSLRYLPLFADDLVKAHDYIAHKLKNQKAAQDLVAATEQAILDRLPYAESFEQFHSQKTRANLYFRIDVENYVVYYVVIGSVMEVRRFLYGGQDRSRLL